MHTTASLKITSDSEGLVSKSPPIPSPLKVARGSGPVPPGSFSHRDAADRSSGCEQLVVPMNTKFFCREEVAVGDDFLEGPPNRSVAAFLEFADQMVREVPSLKRLAGVEMSCACHTSLGEGFKNRDRLSHVLVTAKLAFEFATKIGMSHRDAVVAGVMGLFHDPHAPFSHSFEIAVSRLVDEGRLNGPVHPQLQEQYRHWLFHDERSITLFFASQDLRLELKSSRYLANLNLNHPAIFAAAMADKQEDLLRIADLCKAPMEGLEELYDRSRGVNFLVRQLADRFAYLPPDLQSLDLYGFGTLHYARAAVLPNRLARTIRLVPDPKNSGCDRIAFTDEAFEAVVDAAGNRRGSSGILRTLLEVRGVARLCSVDGPAGALVKRVLEDDLRRFLRSDEGRCTLVFDEAAPDNTDALVNGSDAGLKALLSPETQEMLAHGVDRFSVPLGAWRLSSLSPQAVHHIQEPGTLDLIQRQLATRLGLPSQSLYVVVTADTSMKMDVLRVSGEEEIKAATISAYVPSTMRWVFVVASKPSLQGKDESRLVAAVEEFFRGYTVEGAGLFNLGAQNHNERSSLFDPKALQAEVVRYPPVRSRKVQ